jgi:hypothetical protein
MFHHDTFVGSVVEALAPNQHRVFEVMVLWLGGFVHHHAVKNFLAPCEPDGLEVAHLQILPSAPPSRGAGSLGGGTLAPESIVELIELA